MNRAFGYLFGLVGAAAVPFWAAFGDPAGVIAGLVVGGLGALALLGVDVVGWPARCVRWARPRFMWRHQLAQVAVTAGGAVLAYVLGGWGSAATVVVVSALVAVDAGVEGRHTERRRTRLPAFLSEIHRGD